MRLKEALQWLTSNYDVCEPEGYHRILRSTWRDKYWYVIHNAQTHTFEVYCNDCGKSTLVARSIYPDLSEFLHDVFSTDWVRITKSPDINTMKSRFNYEEAYQMLRTGAKVRRASWDEDAYVIAAFSKLGDVKMYSNTITYKHDKSVQYTIYTPYYDDMSAEDWEIYLGGDCYER